MIVFEKEMLVLAVLVEKRPFPASMLLFLLEKLLGPAFGAVRKRGYIFKNFNSE